MLKKRWWLLPLLAALAAAAILWAVQLNSPTEQPETVEATAQPYTMIYESDPASWTRMEISGRDFEPFAVKSDMVYENGQLLGVRNGLAQPILLEGNESFRFGVYGYQMLLLVAQHLPAIETIGEAVGGNGAYGLDRPAIVCRSAYSDGSERTVSIGAPTPSGSGCYVSVDGCVYVVPSDLYQTLIGGLNGLHALPSSLGFTPEQVTGLQIERAGEATLQLEKTAESTLLPYRMIAPIAHDASKERLLQALEHVCAALPEAYVGSVASDEDLARYGLAEPALRLTLVIEAQYMAQITIGADTEDGAAYMTVDRSGDVYRVSKDKLTFADELTCDRLLERAVSLVPLTELSEARATDGANERSLSLVWTDNETQPTQYMLDGEVVERAAFTALYQSLLTPTFDKTAFGTLAQSDARLTLTFALRDGSSRVVRYLPYNDFYDAVELDGQVDFLIRCTKVDALLKTLFDGR